MDHEVCLCRFEGRHRYHKRAPWSGRNSTPIQNRFDGVPLHHEIDGHRQSRSRHVSVAPGYRGVFRQAIRHRLLEIRRPGAQLRQPPITDDKVKPVGSFSTAVEASDRSSSLAPDVQAVVVRPSIREPVDQPQ